MMVGSELPTPETRESTTVTDVVALAVDDAHRRRPSGGRAASLDRRVASTCTPARSSASPASRATARPSWSTRSWASSTAHAGRSLLDGADLTVAEHPRSPRAAASATSRRTGTATAWCCRCRCGRTCCSATRAGRRSRRGFWIDRGGTKARTERDRRATSTCARPSIEVAAFTLSGGNQQKLIVGREMTRRARRVLVAAHPTRGVDVGAQAADLGHLRDARAQGLAVLLVSADLEELIGLSDRLLVMLRGADHRRARPATVTPAELGSYMTGARDGRREPPELRRIGRGAARARCRHGRRHHRLVDRAADRRQQPDRRVPGDVERTSTAPSRVVLIINQAVPLLRRRRRRRHRVQDEPVQHRRRRAVPAGRPVRRRVGASISLPAPLHVLTFILVAMLVGPLWAAIAGVLKVTRGVNEVISTIMLNYIAIGLSAFLLISYFQNKRRAANLITSTNRCRTRRCCPTSTGSFELFGFHFRPTSPVRASCRSRSSSASSTTSLLFRSRFGYNLRMSAAPTPQAARSAGVNPKG